MNIPLIFAFIILVPASISDIRTKEISIAVPLLLAGAGAIYSYTNGVSVAEALLSFTVLTLFSLLSRQRFGLGDALTVSALALFCGGRLLLMMTTAMSCAVLLVTVKKLVCKKADIKEIAMLPFITLGFAAAML